MYFFHPGVKFKTTPRIRMRFYLEQQELVTLRANGTNPMGEPPNVDLSLVRLLYFHWFRFKYLIQLFIYSCLQDKTWRKAGTSFHFSWTALTGAASWWPGRPDQPNKSPIVSLRRRVARCSQKASPTFKSEKRRIYPVHALVWYRHTRFSFWKK